MATKKVYVTIPYVAGISEKIQRVFQEFNTTFKPLNTLRHMLVHPKDKLDKNKRSGVVYGIKCDQEGCTDKYIGETAQPLRKHYVPAPPT